MLLIFIKILFILINGAIALYDFSFYRIPNVFLGMLLVLYAFAAPLYLGVNQFINSLIAFAIVLIIGFGLFAFKFIAAGDAKYLAVTSLWVGSGEVLSLIFIISLAGGLLGLIYLFLGNQVSRLSDLIWIEIQKLERNYPLFEYAWVASGIGAERGKRENIGTRIIPYGIAIAIGATIVMLYNPLY